MYHISNQIAVVLIYRNSPIMVKTNYESTIVAIKPDPEQNYGAGTNCVAGSGCVYLIFLKRDLILQK